ncbi:MAG: L-threonine 3-dehydrogenase [Fimbriimonadales bacterium]|nr:L-threonine 3-dehydrogenase [Fimbriimonadales bacterium]
MQAIVKAQPAPGIEIREVPEPQVRPGWVKVCVRFASVCGTDLHIYAWDPWAASRIHPPRIIGHEFAGEVVELGEGVRSLREGDFVAGESHITCGKCRQCQIGQRHVCVNTQIIGVDVDGGFAPFIVIPEENARKTHPSIPPEIACVQDPLGNAVHTALAGPVENQDILITGAGPIGLFAIGICKALNARSVAVTEVSPFRINLAQKMGADLVINPAKEDVRAILSSHYPKGVDGVLEMSGHPEALNLALQIVRPGGRVSLLGLFAEPRVSIALNDAIFKGLEIQCIIGRRLWQTWEKMGELLASGRLDVSPVITHRLHYLEFATAMELIARGETGKVVFQVG